MIVTARSTPLRPWMRFSRGSGRSASTEPDGSLGTAITISRRALLSARRRLLVTPRQARIIKTPPEILLESFRELVFMLTRTDSLVLLVSAALSFAAGAAESPADSGRLAQSPAPLTAAASDKLLTIDTPIMELLGDPRTRTAVERHLPRLAQRLLEDDDAALLLGNSTPRELAIDPHVRGITDALLARLQADLVAAQNPPRP
jgi:hypothetical protein